MRVIAGTLGGRTIHEPRGHRTHPMSEKLRGALFNALGDIEGLSVLDGFAGSGALSIEAISRGANHATATEIDKQAYSQVLQNLRGLQIEDQVKAVRANASGWSDNNAQKRFDIVLLDPPYDDLQITLLKKIVERHAKKGGTVVLSFPGNSKLPNFKDMKMLSQKNYGDAQLVFYRRL